MGGHAFDVEAADDEEAASVFFPGGFVDAGGDEQVCQIRPAEGTGGGFQAWQGDAVQFVAAVSYTHLTLPTIYSV